MQLSNWIENEGPKNIAKKMKVDESSISYWKNGKRFPSFKHLVQLHKLSGGKVSYDELIRHFANGERRRKVSTNK